MVTFFIDCIEVYCDCNGILLHYSFVWNFDSLFGVVFLKKINNILTVHTSFSVVWVLYATRWKRF